MPLYLKAIKSFKTQKRSWEISAIKERRFVLIYGVDSSLTEGLKVELKNLGYRCIKSTNSNEIEQVGKQFGRVAISFFDHRFAVNFLRESDFSTFHKYRVVFLKSAYYDPENSMDL